jgi:hypothetical protein
MSTVLLAVILCAAIFFQFDAPQGKNSSHLAFQTGVLSCLEAPDCDGGQEPLLFIAPGRVSIRGPENFLFFLFNR